MMRTVKAISQKIWIFLMLQIQFICYGFKRTGMQLAQEGKMSKKSLFLSRANASLDM